MKQRIAAQAFRAGIEPAIGGLEQAGEDFRVFGPGQEPAWSPAWIPAGCSSVPWNELGSVQRSGRGMAGEARLALLCRLLAERLGPDERFLIVPEGKNWTMALPRAAFDRHAPVLVETARPQAWFVAPPAQWLIELDWDELLWKDG